MFIEYYLTDGLCVYLCNIYKHLYSTSIYVTENENPVDNALMAEALN